MALKPDPTALENFFQKNPALRKIYEQKEEAPKPDINIDLTMTLLLQSTEKTYLFPENPIDLQKYSLNQPIVYKSLNMEEVTDIESEIFDVDYSKKLSELKESEPFPKELMEARRKQQKERGLRMVFRGMVTPKPESIDQLRKLNYGLYVNLLLVIQEKTGLFMSENIKFFRPVQSGTKASADM